MINKKSDMKFISHMIRRKIINPILRKKLKNKNLTILSSTCNGGILYSDLGIKFNSPTINLYIMPKDFIKFLKNLDYYLEEELLEYRDSNFNYPVGKLNDIKIYFQHYESFEKAKESWDIRKKRIQKDNIFIIFTDRDGCEYEDLIEFDNLQYKNKVVFTNRKYNKINSSYYIKGFEKEKSIGIITDYENIFAKRYIDQFNYIFWFNSK